MNQRLHVHPDTTAIQETLVLDAIARRLARKYPPDWLERQGRPLYLATVSASFVAAVLAGLAWGPWWGFLIPLLAPSCVLIVLPRLLFGRITGRPRWAHPLATLDRQDVDLLRRAVVPAEVCASISGERFFHIWWRAHARSRGPARRAGRGQPRS